MATLMTEQDLKDAHPLADKIITVATEMRPPAAVAGIALALAATTHLAECGPEVAVKLFRHYYAELEQRKNGG